MNNENRFYIEDEHIYDSEGMMTPFWVEIRSHAEEICSELNTLYYGCLMFEDSSKTLRDESKENRKRLIELYKEVLQYKEDSIFYKARAHTLKCDYEHAKVRIKNLEEQNKYLRKMIADDYKVLDSDIYREIERMKDKE